LCQKGFSFQLCHTGAQFEESAPQSEWIGGYVDYTDRSTFIRLNSAFRFDLIYTINGTGQMIREGAQSGFMNMCRRLLTTRGELVWIYPDLDMYNAGSCINSVFVRLKKDSPHYNMTVFGRVFEDTYVDKLSLVNQGKHDACAVTIYQPTNILAMSGIMPHPGVDAFETDGWKMYSAIVIRLDGETDFVLGRVFGDQRSHMNKPLPLSTSTMGILQYSRFMAKQKHDGIPVFLWGSSQGCVIVDLNGNTVHEGLQPPRTGGDLWCQFERLGDHYYYVDGKYSKFQGNFSERKARCLDELMNVLEVRDEWFRPVGSASFKGSRKWEGIVIQLEDVWEPLYYHRGNPVRTSFYVKNVYTVDLSHRLAQSMAPLYPWLVDIFIIKEFDLKGNYIRDRLDKTSPNSLDEIEAAHDALSVTDFRLLYDQFAHMNNGQAYPEVPALLFDDVEKLSDDLMDLNVQQFMVSARNDPSARRKRDQIVSNALLLMKRRERFGIGTLLRPDGMAGEEEPVEGVGDDFLGENQW